MSHRWNGRQLVPVDPEPSYIGQRAGVGPGPVDPFKHARLAGSREAGKRAIELQDLEQPPRERSEPAERSALATGPRGRLLHEAAQAWMRLGQSGDEAPGMLSEVLAEQRAEYERLGEDTSDPLFNAAVATEIAETVEDDADKIAAQRAEHEQVMEFITERFGSVEAMGAWLAQLPADEEEDVLDQLAEAFDEEFPVVDDEYDYDDGGEPAGDYDDDDGLDDGGDGDE